MAKSQDAPNDTPCNYCFYLSMSACHFHETKLTSFSVLEFSQSYIGKCIVLLGTSVMSVGLVQILSY